jgi:regulatory protein
MSKIVPPLQQRLREAALAYLGRGEASLQSVRRLLQRRVARWAEPAGLAEGVDAGPAIDAVLARLVAERLVDDSRYAEVKTLSLFRAGRSSRAIRAYLATRGIDTALVDDALASRGPSLERAAAGDSFAAGAAGEDLDLVAALRFAARKRLGRFRAADQRALRRDRDLAALGRAGFSWAVARQVVDQDDGR